MVFQCIQDHTCILTGILHVWLFTGADAINTDASSCLRVVGSVCFVVFWAVSTLFTCLYFGF